VTARVNTSELADDFRKATIPNAAIHTIPQVRALAALADKLTTTTLPGGKLVRMQPKAVDLAGSAGEFAFPPHYGQHTRQILAEAGLSGEYDSLAQAGIVPETA
jgi:crotonobetainyl-CoA:carnitine CoA-transferase CaiB-like acyl-CoA transferase